MSKEPVSGSPIWESELLSGATFERNATFTLALDKARQKLEKFQLPDPTFYILQILQAIIASGAKTVAVEHNFAEIQGRSTISIVFDGPGYSAAELHHLNDFLFESGRSREKDRTREMALGIVSCLALRPLSLRLVSRGQAWERKNEKEQVVPAAPAEQNTNLFQVVRHGPAPEKDLLRSHCLACPVELSLNSAIICTTEGGIHGSCPWPNFRFRVGDINGYFGIGYGQLEKSALTLLRYGVQFTRRLESRVYPPLVIICEDPDLRKNASQSDVVEDAEYLRFIAQLGRVQRDFSIGLASQRIPPYQQELVQRYLLTYFEQFIPNNLIGLQIDHLEPDLQRILRVPLFTGTSGRRYSLEAVLQAYRQDGSLFLSQKKRPRARVDDIVILCPSDWERQLLLRVFDRSVQVDDTFDSLVAQVRERRGLHSVDLPEALYEQGGPSWRGLVLKVAIGDAPLENQIYFYYADPNGVYQRAPLNLGKSPSGAVSLSAFVCCLGPVKDAAKVLLPALDQLALQIESQLPSLYKCFWEMKLSKANRKIKFAGKIARATDHLANGIRYFREVDPDHLRETFWTSRFLEDRQGRLVSLADIDTWLKVYPSVALTLGGPVFDGDFALKSSPEICAMLKECFGADKVLQATVEHPCLKQREQQVPLAGCADGPALELVKEESEEEELERLKREYEEAKTSPPPPEKPPLPAEAPQAAFTTNSESESEPESVQETPFQAYEKSFYQLRKFAVIVHGGGTLALVADFQSPLVGKIHRWQDGSMDSTWDCSPLPVCGWLPDELDEATVSAALLELYQVVATRSSEPQEATRAAAMRRLLLQFLCEHPKFVMLRGPLTEAPLFTMRGGQLVSLAELRRTALRFGFLAYCYPGDTLPPGGEGAVLLTGAVTVEVLTRLFGVKLTRLQATKGPKGTAAQGQDQLLKQIRKWLEELSQIPEAKLDGSLTDGVGWGEPTKWFGGRKKYFVEHHDNGLTELNPAHNLVKSIVRSREGPERMAPVLASSVYTAINRALHEIEDIHELAFLEALLDRLDNTGTRP